MFLSKILTAVAAIMIFSGVVQANSFIGIGIIVQEEDKSIQIVDVYENSPASRANIVPGDWITAVDGKPTAGQKLKVVAEWLKGGLGTQVTLSLRTNKRDASHDVLLTRAVIEFKCFMEGNVSLNYYSSGNGFGSLSGYINNESINWNVSSGRVSGYYNGEFISSLSFEENTNDIRLSGWIRGAYIEWRGYFNRISAFQNCIR